MKNSFKRIAAAITAITLCSVPMINGISSNAHVYYIGDYNYDDKIDEEDYNLLKNYVFSKIYGFNPKETNPNLITFFMDLDRDGIPDGDFNGDGFANLDDPEVLRIITDNNFDLFLASEFLEGTQGKCVRGDANGDLVFDRDDPFALNRAIHENYNAVNENGLECYKPQKLDSGLDGSNKYDIPLVLFNRSNMNFDDVLDKRDVDLMYEELKRTDPEIKQNAAIYGPMDSDYLLWLLEQDDLAQDRNELIQEILKYLSEWGDVNYDGKKDMSDVVAVQQYIINPKKYPLSADQIKRANIYRLGQSNESITVGDLTAMQLRCSGWTINDFWNKYVKETKSKITGKTRATVVDSNETGNLPTLFEYYTNKNRKELGL